MPRARRAARFTTLLLGVALLTSISVPVVRAGAVSTVEIRVPSPDPEANHAFNIAARPSSDVHDAGGTLSFFLDDAVDPLPGCEAIDPGEWGNYAFCAIGATDLAPGTYTITVEYSGTALIDASSGQTSLTVGPDVVHALAFQQYLTFYPIKDGYRDKVIIGGERSEPITATLRIYSPAGALIKTVGFAEATTPFAYAWDGRYTAGGLRPEGKYKLTVTFVDEFGTTLLAIGFVNLSHKKLIWHTKTIERTGKSADDSGGHIGTAFTFAGSSYIKIIPSTGSGQASWDFTIPSAVAYESLTFKAYAKHQRTTGDTTFLGLENFAVPGCPTLVASLPPPSCFGGKHAVGNSSGTPAWFSSGSVLSGYRYGWLVRGIVYGTKKVTYVYRVQLVVKYATLGY
jgi:hypothetical protein